MAHVCSLYLLTGVKMFKYVYILFIWFICIYVLLFSLTHWIVIQKYSYVGNEVVVSGRVHHWDGSESNSQRQRWIDTPNWAVYLSEYQLKIFKHHIIYYHYLEGTPIINKPWFMNPELNSKTYWPTVSMLIDVPRRKVELWRSSSVLPSEADVLPTEKGGWPGGILAPQNSTTTRKSKRWKAIFAFLLFYRFFRIIVQTLNVPSHYERRLLELEISQVQHEVLHQTQS